MEKIVEKISLLQMVLPWIVTWGVLCILEKRRKKKEKERKNEERYIIENDGILFPFFLLGTFLFLFCLFYTIFFTKFEISEVIAVSMFAIFFAVLTLDNKFWRVMVEGDVIKYRSLYGITRTYSFNDISKGVYTKKGSLKVYVGEKRIFTFYDNLEFSLFDQQMRKKKIPITLKNDISIIRPQSSYLIITIFIFIALVSFTILSYCVQDRNLYVCVLGLLFSIGSFVMLMDLLLDKTIIEGDTLRRKKFLKKESIVSFSDVSGVEIHKGWFRNNLVIYKNEKEVMSIWLKNEGINWLKAKLQKEKIRTKKKIM